jgi:phage shock protein C
MSTPVKRLYRSRKERMFAGIAGGLGQYFGVDPTLVRIAFIFFSFWIGGGFLAYLIMWIVIPEEPDSIAAPVTLPETPQPPVNEKTPSTDN